MAALNRAEIATLVHGADSTEDESQAVFTCVGSIPSATAESIVFAQDEATLRAALLGEAGLILATDRLSASTDSTIDASDRRNDDRRVLWVKDARLAFARVGQAFARQAAAHGIHPSAVVADDATLGDRVSIGAGAVVESGVRLGNDVVLGSRVTVHAGCELGHRVTVGAGSVLGGSGFGWVRDPDSGEYLPFPQQGTLWIGEDVSIGSNCTIDRGALDRTRIGAGTKIDSLVHIAHSCQIGRRVVIAAQTGIAGSSEVGEGAIIAGQVGIADHVQIGAGVVLGAKCGVPSHKQVRGAGQVFWGIPARPIKQYLRELAFLRRGLER